MQDIREDAERDDVPSPKPVADEPDSKAQEGVAEVPGEAPAEIPPAPTPDEAVDFKDRWLRAEAELQNFRRRARRDGEEARRAAEEVVLLDLVTLLDDLERALQSAGEGGAPPTWAEGVALVLQKGRDYLERQGVLPVDPLGQPFDPTLHEAILEVEAAEGAAPGSVVQVVHKGYRRGGRALRAARVVVARGHGGES